MSKFAVVVLLPETDDKRWDFMSREFNSLDDIIGALRDLEENVPNWRIISFCHTEDLPLLMEEPKRADPE